MMNNKIHESSGFGERTVSCLFCLESAAVTILMMMNPSVTVCWYIYGEVTSEVISFPQVSILWEHMYSSYYHYIIFAPRLFCIARRIVDL